MNVNHRPIFNVEKACKLYSEKDGVPVTYICTSALGSEAQAMDIFYRATPHPEFGNRYFGLYYSVLHEGIMICNADAIETAEFGMVEVNGQFHYSQHRHDFYTIGDVTLDGGRAYHRRLGNMRPPTRWVKIKDGKFVEEQHAPA